MSKENRDKRNVLPMFHNEDFWCAIPDATTYADVLSGKKEIPEKCTSVRIPKSVFFALAAAQVYIDLEAQGKLAIIPLEVGDPVFWFYQLDEKDKKEGTPEGILEGVVKGLRLNGTRVIIDTGDEGGGIIGAIGYNADYRTYVFADKNAADQLYNATESDVPSDAGAETEANNG